MININCLILIEDKIEKVTEEELNQHKEYNHAQVKLRGGREELQGSSQKERINKPCEIQKFPTLIP